MTCAHTLGVDGLRCTRDEHDDNGHVYESGSFVDDRHEDGGHG